MASWRALVRGSCLPAGDRSRRRAPSQHTPGWQAAAAGAVKGPRPTPAGATGRMRVWACVHARARMCVCVPTWPSNTKQRRPRSRCWGLRGCGRSSRHMGPGRASGPEGSPQHGARLHDKPAACQAGGCKRAARCTHQPGLLRSSGRISLLGTRSTEHAESTARLEGQWGLTAA